MFLSKYNNDESYGVAHIGWGAHEGASWTYTPYFSSADTQGYLGAVRIAFGTNIGDSPARHSGLGGRRRAPSHLDIDLLNHNVYLDDDIIIEKGNIVHADCR